MWSCMNFLNKLILNNGVEAFDHFNLWGTCHFSLDCGLESSMNARALMSMYRERFDNSHQLSILFAFLVINHYHFILMKTGEENQSRNERKWAESKHTIKKKNISNVKLTNAWLLLDAFHTWISHTDCLLLITCYINTLPHSFISSPKEALC